MDDYSTQSLRLINALTESPDGFQKNASDVGTNMIRRILRENSFLDVIIEPKTVTNSDLNYRVDTELPVIVEEMEPKSKGAVSLSFNASADTEFYRFDKFEVYFHKISTPEFTKSVEELRTYKNDVRKVIADNALKDMQTEQDGRFITYVDKICGSIYHLDSSSGGVGYAGVPQNTDTAVPFGRVSVVDMKAHLEKRRLNNGCWLVNRTTANQYMKWDRNEMGGDMSEKLVLQGNRAMEKFEFVGVPHVATIKDELVPDFVFYQFTEQGWLGRHYVLQEPTMFVEKKEDIIRFKAVKKLGFTIANVAGVHRHQFTNVVIPDFVG